VTRATNDNQFAVLFRKDYADIIDTESNEVMLSGYARDGMKWFNFVIENQPISANAVTITENVPNKEEKINKDVMLWHQRFGHCSAKNLRLACRVTQGMPKLRVPDDIFRECRTCIESKATRESHKGEQKRPHRKFLVIHSDILDPKCEAHNGCKYIVTFTCGFSGLTKGCPIKNKSNVPAVFTKYHKWLSNRFPNHPVAILRADKAAEYVTGEMEAYCEAAGIEIDSGVLYTPEFNGLAERMNHTLLEKMRALLIDSGFELDRWPWVVKVAEYLLNRLPTKINVDNETPIEVIYGEKPSISNLRRFGCLGLVLIPKEVKAKVEMKKKKKKNYKTHRMMDVTRKLVRQNLGP